MGGIRVLIGEYDGSKRAAAMVNDSSGWMIGPIFEAEDAPEQIEAFLQWLRDYGWTKDEELAARIRAMKLPLGDGTDARHWDNGAGLEHLVKHWRAEFVGDDGWLLDPHECVCRHRHVMNDVGAEQGCVALGLGCECREWSPGNRLGEKLVAAGETGLVE